MESMNNRYLLHGILGEGGMSVVYRATGRLTGRQKLQNDERLAEQLKRGDRAALDSLVERHYDSLIGYLYCLTYYVGTRHFSSHKQPVKSVFLTRHQH